MIRGLVNLFNFRVVMFISMALVSAGCSVRFPQVENICHSLNFKAPFVKGYQWRMFTDSYTADMIAVSVPSGVVFASKKDDALLFDGVVVRRVVKIGNDKDSYEIVDTPQGNQVLRQMLVNGQHIADHLCDSWEKQLMYWRQECRNKIVGTEKYTNILRFDAQGQLNEIDQVVTAARQRVKLKKYL